MDLYRPRPLPCLGDFALALATCATLICLEALMSEGSHRESGIPAGVSSRSGTTASLANERTESGGIYRALRVCARLYPKLM